MKKLSIVVILVFAIQYLQAQPGGLVTLEKCYESAKINYPNYNQTELNNAIYELNIENAGTNYYPSLYLNGQVSWQSDVTKINIPAAAGFKAPEISKDWYKINFDVNQTIYDGGITKGQKELHGKERDISNQEVQIELYQLKERINHLYFNIIFLKKNIEILDILSQNLKAGISDAVKAYDNGVILKSELEKLKVELIQVDQQIIDKNSDTRAIIASLNELTKLSIKSAGDLETPELSISDYSFINNRPEYLMLSKQQEKITSVLDLSNSKRRPKFSAFGQAGYGRPGYDMLNDNFDDYYMIGARLNWNIWDWNKVKNEKQVLNIQNEIIDNKKETFNQNLKTELIKRIEEISKYKELLITDVKIIELQDNIVKTTLAQLNNGSITSTTYLIELNKLTKASVAMESHKLQLVFAKYQYITAIGNL
jgi:outer membrane protein TolC